MIVFGVNSDEKQYNKRLIIEFHIIPLFAI